MQSTFFSPNKRKKNQSKIIQKRGMACFDAVLWFILHEQTQKQAI